MSQHFSSVLIEEWIIWTARDNVRVRSRLFSYEELFDLHFILLGVLKCVRVGHVIGVGK